MKPRAFYLFFAVIGFAISAASVLAAMDAQMHHTIIPGTREFGWLSPAQGFSVAGIGLVLGLYSAFGLFRCCKSGVARDNSE